MNLVTDEAVTLSVSDYSETSQIVTLFSLHNGKVRLLAKGSKRPKSSFGGPVDRLQLVQAVFSVRPQGGLGLLTELSQRELLPGLRDNLPAFYAASYLSELALLATEELDPAPAIFQMLRQTLMRLSCGADSAILVYRYEVRLLQVLGLLPELAVCVACRRPRPAGVGALFSAGAGGVVCQSCGRQGGATIRLGTKTLAALAFLAVANDAEIERVRLSGPTATEMRRFMHNYWPYVLGRQPRSMRWVS